MRLEIASKEAIKYACLKFHYSRTMPVRPFGYSVFNDKDEWCGCILYGLGANNNMAKHFNLAQGQAVELVRVALNGKQANVSKPLALSLKLLRKQCPFVRLVFSYADKEQGHEGIIYQATNWIKKYETKGEIQFRIKGKLTHTRSLYGKIKRQSIDEVRKSLDKNAEVYKTKGKILYYYPLRPC